MATHMNFYLGTHEPSSLRDSTIPLFISHRRLHHRRTLPTANTNWALDSGAFSEIAQHGHFTTTPTQYINAIRRYRDHIGQLDWAAPQDHMTEPWILARSEIASTVAEAQAWTTHNYLTLRALNPTLPIIPVIQGQTLNDYLTHIDLYANAGINLQHQPLVGLGSVCRRQATTEIAELVAALSHSLNLHGFGVKTSGLSSYGWMLTSSDSMAWSYNGRRIRPCPQRGLTSCANCRHHAMAWRTHVLTQCQRRDPVQLALA